MKHVDLAVVGGGITGLAAAWEAHQRGADVVVLDAADHPGGKLQTSTFAGLSVDESADAFLARRPEAVGLCRELGIEDRLVSPTGLSARLWSPIAGHLLPMPKDQLLGVPTDLDQLANSGLLSADGLARAAEDLDGAGSGAGPAAALARDQDTTVGELVRSRLGDEVHDLLVAPLLGGVWAGDTDRLSVDVTAPAIAEAARRDASLIRGARAVREAGAANAPGGPDAPVFYAPRGGMTDLVAALIDRLGDRVRPGEPVKALFRGGRAVPGTSISATANGGTQKRDDLPDGGTWRLDPLAIEADAVVVATPAASAAELVGPWCRSAADTLAGIPHSSVVLVTLAVPRDGVDHALDGSGFLVPRTAGLLMTACSWTSSKWAHLAGDGGTALLRVSAGHAGDSRALEMSDADLMSRIREDLATTMGVHAPPRETRIRRWINGFPQPRPGHLATVAELERTLAAGTPGLAVAGAWARGVGIPACIASGRTTAAQLLAR